MSDIPNAIMPHSKEPWNPTKYIALCCDDIIWSERPGQFKRCKCGGAFVDETREYARYSGQLKEYIPVSSNRNNLA